MDKCILCEDSPAEERKYFLEKEAICTFHYCQYLEILIEEIKKNVTSREKASAYRICLMDLKPKPFSKEEKSAFLKKVQNSNAKAREESRKAHKYSNNNNIGL